MINALQSEVFRLRRRPQSWMMLVLTVLFIALFYTIIYLVYQFGDASNRSDLRDSMRVLNLFENGMQVFGFFGGILMIIVASSLIGSEYAWNTLRPLVARATSRSGLLSAKWIVVFAYTALIVIVGVVGSILTATAVSLISDTTISLPGEYWDDFAVGTLRWFMASIPYTAIAFMAALVTRSNAAGIAIGIGISFVEPLLFPLLSLLSDVFDTVQEYGISWNVQQVTNISTQAGGGSFQEPVDASQVWQSAGVLVVYVLIAVVVTYVVFNRRDIISG